MQIYSLISQKGGAGKSTLARQLAVLAGETEPSLIIDRDPQRTTTKWWTRREQIEPPFERPELVDLDGTALTDAAKSLRRKPEGALFIDTRPAVEEPEAEAARVADEAARQGVLVDTLARHHAGPPRVSGLVIGYGAAASTAELRTACALVRELATRRPATGAPTRVTARPAATGA